MKLGIRGKLVAIVGASLVGALLVSFAVFTTFYRRNLELVLERTLSRLSSGAQSAAREEADKLGAALEAIARDEKLAGAFVARDRDALYALSAPLLARLRERYAVTHLYFHEPGGTVFLRTHAPEQFGDRVTRTTFLRATRTLELSSGFEPGMTAFALRAVLPWRRGGAVIGYLELGEDVDRFVEKLAASEGDSLGLVIDKRLIDRDAWASAMARRSVAPRWDALRDYVWVDRRDPELASSDCFDDRLLARASLVPAWDDAHVVGEDSRVCAGIPFDDPDGRAVGAIVARIDMSHHTRVLAQLRRSAALAMLALLGAAFGVFAWATTSMVIRPVRAIAEGAAVFASGSLRDHRIAVRSSDELGQLASALNSMAASLDLLQTEARARADELGAANERLSQLATTDGLTSLANHRQFQARLREEVERARRHGRPLSLAIADVDHFKTYNDTHGHVAGDAALVQVSGVLARSCRTHDLVARYGGEEFALLLPDTELVAASALAERVRRAVATERFEGGYVLPGGHLTVSLGVAQLDPASRDPADLVVAADAALYRAKQAGRDRVVS